MWVLSNCIPMATTSNHIVSYIYYDTKIQHSGPTMM